MLPVGLRPLPQSLQQIQRLPRRLSESGVIEDAPAVLDLSRGVTQPLGCGPNHLGRISRVVDFRGAVEADVQKPLPAARQSSLRHDSWVGGDAGHLVALEQRFRRVAEPCLVTWFAGELATEPFAEVAEEPLGRGMIVTQARWELHKQRS